MTESIYKTAYQLLKSGKRIVLARIIRRSGSTPRDVGAMCLITRDHKLIGTVGGGLVEYNVQKKAVSLLENPQTFIYRFKLSNDDMAKNGMICGGDLDLFLEPLLPKHQQTMDLFKTISEHLDQNKPVKLITLIADGLKPDNPRTRLLMTESGEISGSIEGFEFEKTMADNIKGCQVLEDPQTATHIFIESIQMQPMAFLFGGGHVSACVAPLAKNVGFDITVIDDRPEFANKHNFPDADAILVSDFKSAFEKLSISSNAYILIITRGHLHDKTVLDLSLKTPAAYIGMIGSIKKRNIIYRNLMKEGVPETRLEQVYSPVGISINAETPEEIAVSIVAELIKKKNPEKKKKNLLT